jgi:hypothetical protein
MIRKLLLATRLLVVLVVASLTPAHALPGC